MKKLVSTLTAAIFALGLAGAAWAQSATKEGEKPAAKKEAPAGQTQVTPKAPDKPAEAVKPGAKEECKPGDKKPVSKETPKAGDKDKVKDTSKKTDKSGKKVDKKSETPAEKPAK